MMHNALMGRGIKTREELVEEIDELKAYIKELEDELRERAMGHMR